MKPMLASDYVESKIIFPVLIQPKIDGVRGCNLDGVFTGRSLKKHKNVYTTALYSNPLCKGFDGEVAAERETHSALCRITASAIGTIDGSPYTLWWLFDYLTEETRLLDYTRRYEALKKRIAHIQQVDPVLGAHLRLVPSTLVFNLKQFKEIDDKHDEMGYEGSILRDPEGRAKEGRSTVREGGLLRAKRYIEEEAVVDSLEEGQQNTNEAKINELGHTSRSSHKEFMIPSGMVGALNCTDVKTGLPIRVAAGAMTHEERIRFFKYPDLILKKTIKYKTFPKGVKDKPRHPTYQSIKLDSDI